MSNRKKTTKRKLVSSIISLVLCVAMLMGTTFAWFTDTASTGVNTIQAGNLDIVLKYYDSATNSWKEVDSNTKLFDDNALWEPGHTEVAYLHIQNAGSLDLKYKMNVNVPSETGSINQKGDAFKLSDYLVFKVVDMADANPFADRAAAREAAGTAMGLSSWTKAGNLYANPIPTTAPSGSVNEEYVALVIYMPETVGNVANHKTGEAAPEIKLGVNIVATQLNSESDSFGNDYDANADGNPDNGAAWTMAAFRAVADVPDDVSSAGMTITKYENDVVSDENKIAEVVIPANTAQSASLSTTDKVALSVTPADIPVGIVVQPDQAAFNYDVKLMKISSDNTENAIASNGNPVTVKLKVGTGLSGVKIFHTSNGVTTEVSGVTYNSTTGIAEFSTESFSDYTVVYNAKLTSTLPANAKLVMNLEELEAAVENLHDGDYIAFGTNIVQDKVDTTSGQITFDRASDAEGDIEATLDLNGYVFEGQIGGYSFANQGITVNVIGTEEAKAEYFEHETGHHMVYACNVFNYSGKTVIKDGLFKSDNANVMAYGGDVVFDGGKFVNVDEGGVNIYACNDPTVVINDGNYSSEGVIVYVETYRTENGPEVVINGGNFDSSEGSCMFFVEKGTDPYAKITINGGNFVFNSDSDGFIQVSDGLVDTDYLQIKGGTFNVDPSAYVADGYKAVNNTNGTWTVTKVN